MEQREVKPCPNPWCRGRVAPRKLLWPENSFDVNCSCGVNSPACETEELAIAAWNKREPDPLVQQMAQALEFARCRCTKSDPEFGDMCMRCAALKAWQESQQ